MFGTMHSPLVLATTVLATASLVAATPTSSLRTAINTPSHRELEYAAIMNSPTQPSLTCVIESGFDYVGNDIGNAPGKIPEECCAKCLNFSGCKVFSWTAQNGGTCWFKAAQGEIVVNPNVKSAVVSLDDDHTCHVQMDVDFVGNDIGHVKGKHSCCYECRKFPGCRAFSWTDHEGGTCWLKSKAGQAVSKPGVISALAYPPNPEKCYTQPNTDYEGFDIGRAPSTTADGCCRICEGTTRCRAYTWTNHEGGTCWLKSLTGNAVAKPGAVSGSRYPNPYTPCNFESDVDYVGNDIGSARTYDANLCATICKETQGCKAFTYTKYQEGTCWLKSAKGKTVRSPGAASCVVV